MLSEERVAGALSRMLSAAAGPRWRTGDPRALALAAACMVVVVLPELLLTPDTESYEAAAESAHVVLLILLGLVGLRMHLVPGLVVAVASEALLAGTRLWHTDSPRLLVVVWALLGPLVVAAGWGLSEHHRRRAEAQADAAVVTLARAIEANHEGTGDHCDDVVALAVAVGRHLGMAGRRLHDLALAAQLHDVGKLGVPQAILDKPGPLDEDEVAAMRRHPDIGADLVAHLPWLAHLSAPVRAMHERWDGGGYPRRLAGEDIPLLARIVFTCDAYCAMRQDRPYRRALPAGDARRELRDGSGTQFDPDIVAIVERVLDGRPG
jgi:hypothetical protein